MELTLRMVAGVANNFALGLYAWVAGVALSIYGMVAVFAAGSAQAGYVQLAALGCLGMYGIHRSTQLRQDPARALMVPAVFALGLFVCNMVNGTNARFPGAHLTWLALCVAVGLMFVWADIALDEEYDEEGYPRDMMADLPLLSRFRHAIGALMLYFTVACLAVYQPWHGGMLAGFPIAEAALLLLFGELKWGVGSRTSVEAHPASTV